MEDFQFLWVGFEYEKLALFVGGDDGVADEDRGGGDWSAEAFFPHFLAITGPPADGDAVVVQGVEIASGCQHGLFVGFV